MNSRQCLVRCGVMLLLCFFAAVVRADDEFPLRNGNFYDEVTANVAANWHYDTGGGKQKITGRVEIRLELTNGPAASISQEVPLVSGQYAFSAEIAVGAGAKASLAAGKQKIEVGSTHGFERVTLPFEADVDGKTAVGVGALPPGVVAVRKARIDIVKLITGPVPAVSGNPIGRIVLPADPDPAERFAAWELQRFIHQMTGVTPGLEGRDPVTPGRTVLIGRAAQKPQAEILAKLEPESYLVEIGPETITLAGHDPRGTLYAVYDFLKTQGCGWYMPGPAGEVISHRASLELKEESRRESPDWNVRGLLTYMAHFDSSGGHRSINLDDYRDWAVRNRINSLWYGGADTIAFGAHRGFAHMQRLNHSWASFYSDDHPEWYPLVNGKRVKMYRNSGRPNEPCTGNPAFRDHAVAVVLQYFKDHPHANVYALDPEDEPANWCECPLCRATDGDGGKGKWEMNGQGIPKMSMSDRAVDFVNYVAERVAKVYPDKLIELYVYGSYRMGPVRHRVDPHMLLKYCFWPGVPLGGSVTDQSLPGVKRAYVEVESWKKAGVKHFGLYDYGLYVHKDCPIFWFQHIVDSLRMFHDQFGFRHYLGETDNNLFTSMMAFDVRAEALWNRKVDYHRIVREISLALYGSAGPTMDRYYELMHQALLDWKPTWKPVGPKDPVNAHADPAMPGYAGGVQTRALVGSTLGYYWSNDMLEYNLPIMERGQALLDQAAREADGDAMLNRRIDIAQFGHSYMTYLIAKRSMPHTTAKRKIALQAYDRLHELWGKYPETRVQIGTPEELKTFDYPPPAESVLLPLPIEWQFRVDPQDTGIREHCFAGGAAAGWSEIRTDKDWTTQGHDYHGTAWYAVEFKVPADKQAAFKATRPMLYFGAIDGYAEVFLDGKKIGEQKTPPEISWDKPYTVNLPARFDPSVSHQLMVRVEKQNYAAGIWKPVMIIPAEK